MTEVLNKKWGPDNLALLKADYEAGLSSKSKIAKKHQITSVTLWRYAKEGRWEFGKFRDKVMLDVSNSSAQRLLDMRTDTVEEHAILLSSLREEVMETDSIAELNQLSKKLNNLNRIIKAERLCLGLPSEIQQQVNHQK